MSAWNGKIQKLRCVIYDFLSFSTSLLYVHNIVCFNIGLSYNIARCIRKVLVRPAPTKIFSRTCIIFAHPLSTRPQKNWFHLCPETLARIKINYEIFNQCVYIFRSQTSWLFEEAKKVMLSLFSNRVILVIFFVILVNCVILVI